jgi:hypothetical protein
VFIFLVASKLLLTARLVQQGDLDLFLRGGAALDINSVAPKPFPWMTDAAWLNVVVMIQQVPAFKSLVQDVRATEAVWRKWCVCLRACVVWIGVCLFFFFFFFLMFFMYFFCELRFGLFF